ncbi:hypothetical protein BDN72DRAFT_957657 [Pluteus cervinus]|uniref:Uncharacterized protein n=1 Tax=Pluteus cervinus TaxID=181527 RepID=A0ACD3B1S3_9AGAR|nr:hypothetical protein BDN72DRAFT_957657 [Pluteus cervinus]
MRSSTPLPSHTRVISASLLSEEIVQESFHSYLKSSLTQAKAEKLLDEDVLSSAEGDLMITGPALCLYFAALRCTTEPPSVPLPRTIKVGDAGNTSPNTTPLDLSYENCPASFISFLYVWSSCVPLIQSLQPEDQHDLARIICNLPALSDPVLPELFGIAADIRAVAIEISQRRSFQEKYAEDLQAALNAGRPGGTASPKRAAFIPPPSYEESSPSSSPQPSPRISLDKLRPLTPPQPSSPSHLSPNFLPVRPSSPHSPLAPLSPHSRPSSRPVSPSPAPSISPVHPAGPLTSTIFATSSPSSSTTTTTTPSSSGIRTTKLSISNPDSPAIIFIRETLYAALADTIATTPSLTPLLRSNPPRAYFSATSLAILSVATTCIVHIPDTKSKSTLPSATSSLSSVLHPPTVIPNAAFIANYAIRGIGSRLFGLSECPDELRPFMAELISIGVAASQMEEEDTATLIQALQLGKEGDEVPQPRMERVKKILEEGIGGNIRNGRGGGSGMAMATATNKSAGTITGSGFSKMLEEGMGGNIGNGVGVGRGRGRGRAMATATNRPAGATHATSPLTSTSGLGFSSILGGACPVGHHHSHHHTHPNDQDKYNVLHKERGREAEKFGHRRGRSIEGRSVAFANRVNALSLSLTKLRAFRDRQGDVFKVLMSVAGSR